MVEMTEKGREDRRREEREENRGEKERRGEKRRKGEMDKRREGKRREGKEKGREASTYCSPSSHIVVDEFQNTSVKGIYSVGDCSRKDFQLTPVAIAAG